MTLPKFEGREVAKATLRITKTGDGLSEALELDPVALAHGQEVAFVLRGKVTQVNHRESENLMVRQHVVECTGIAPYDDAKVKAIVDAERERISKLRDEATGQQRIEDAPPAHSSAATASDSAATAPEEPRARVSDALPDEDQLDHDRLQCDQCQRIVGSETHALGGTCGRVGEDGGPACSGTFHFARREALSPA